MKRSISVRGQSSLSQKVRCAVYMRVGQESQLCAAPLEEPATRSRTRRPVSVRGPSVSSGAAGMPGKVVRYGIYAREPSRVRSPLDRASVQEQVCKRHLALHAEGSSPRVHVATYIDVGFAAAAPARPSLQRLLADVDAGRIGLIVIAGAWNILAGSAVELEEIFTILKARRVPILSATGLIDPSSDAGKPLLDMVRSLAVLEAQPIDSGSGR